VFRNLLIYEIEQQKPSMSKWQASNMLTSTRIKVFFFCIKVQKSCFNGIEFLKIVIWVCRILHKQILYLNEHDGTKKRAARIHDYKIQV
jgi:hypothetical protein